MTAGERWAAELAAWAIPDHILAVAPESPWNCSPGLFVAPADPGPDTPSRRRAREVLPDGGSVLDVGCGGGAAGLALAPPAGRVTGLDPSAEMLSLFAARAEEMGVEHEAVEGRWPDDAARVGPADVVVCHHVAYNVGDLAAFAVELSSHGRVRVVMELTGRHPRAGLNHLWRHFWDLDRPDGPTAGEAVAAMVEAGIAPEIERWPRPARASSREAWVASARRYLCLPAGRDAEIESVIGDHHGPAGDIVTVWWATT